MTSILIAAGSQKDASALIKQVAGRGYVDVKTAGSAAGAREFLSARHYDIVLVSAPLADEFGCDLAAQAAQDASGVIMLVKSELVDEISTRVEDRCVLVLPKSINKTVFSQSLRFVEIICGQLAVLRHEGMRLRVKIDELRICERAKAVLMQYLNMTEEQAHRYLEKQAMDLRMTRMDVARNILKTYES